MHNRVLILGLNLVLIAVLFMDGCTSKESAPAQISSEPAPSEPYASTLALNPSVSSASPVIASKTYINSEYGLSVEYPADWDLNENLTQQERLLGVLVRFLGPQSEKYDYRANISVQVAKLPANSTLESFAAGVELQILRKNLSDYVNLQERTGAIGGMPAILRTFTATIGSFPHKCIQAYMVKGDFVYRITYDVTIDSYDTYADCVDLALSTFSLITNPAPASTKSPTITPTPTEASEVKTVKLTDPTDDLFDKSGNPIKDQPYLDIVEADVSDSGTEYVLKMKLNGQIPQKTPDSQILYEWAIYLDTDNNLSTGEPWTLVANDLCFEYLARVFLLDNNYSTSLYDLKTRTSGNLKYSINDNIIELRFPKSILQSDEFNFTVAAKKYGERGAGSAFMLADKVPNLLHANFPAGELLDTDRDGFTDEEEVSIMKTDPNVAEKWDDLNTVTGLLDTPKKISLFLDRKYQSVRRPSTLFSTSVTQLFKEMYGDCDEYAMLAIYWLVKNGYDAYMVDAYFNKWWEEYNQWLEHDICVYQEKDGAWYSMDLYFHGLGKNPVGPFKSINEICDSLPAHHGATDWIRYILYDSDGRLVNKVEK